LAREFDQYISGKGLVDVSAEARRAHKKRPVLSRDQSLR